MLLSLELRHKIKKISKNFYILKFKAVQNTPVPFKSVKLPLARIKRLMKIEEEIKMVAAEVPILFSKLTEVFIEDITLRAWINTSENKRRIIQRSDIAVAAQTSEIFDFLVFIVPNISLNLNIDYERKTELKKSTVIDFNKMMDYEGFKPEKKKYDFYSDFNLL